MTKMNQLKKEFSRDWFIITSLVTKDFKLKYRRSVLGIIWSVLNPLMMMAVLTFVFSHVFKFEVENFPLYLILGLTLYNFMNDATQGSLMSIIDSAPLIKKIRIKKWLFPVERTLFSLVNYVISLISVAIVMVFFQIAPTINIVFLPLLLAYVFMFSLGIGFIVATLNVFFRDMEHIWSVFTLAWMYATPIIYPVEALPAELIPIMEFNPMYHYVSYMREIALWGVTPGLMENLVCFGFAAVTLLTGLLVFRKASKRFILYV